MFEKIFYLNKNHKEMEILNKKSIRRDLSINTSVEISYGYQGRFTVCVVNIDDLHMGVSHCSLEDRYNKGIGENIAFVKAVDRYISKLG